METPSVFPKPEDISIEGLKDITVETVRGLLSVDGDLWKEDAANIKEFYAKFEGKIPAELENQLSGLVKRLG